MSDFNFNSASVQTVEKDIQPNVSKPLSLTTLGLIGETPKGPAFQPIQVSRSNFAAIFGGLNNEKLGNDLRFPLNYYANSFLKEADDLYVTRVLGLSGYQGGPAWAITATSTGDTPFTNQLVAVVRSRAEYTDANTLVRKVSTLGAASYNATTQKLTLAVGARSLSFSMNPDSPDFISRVLGTSATDKTTDIYVDTVYTDALRKMLGTGSVTFSGMRVLDSPVNTATGWKTPETPWVVSQLRGNTVEKLFKMVMISDGDSANKEAKVSIENIDPISKEFDVVIRDFNDNDDNIVVLERFSRCTMDSGSSKFVGRRMGSRITGSSEMIHDSQSNYVIVELSREFSDDSFPCGFLGYPTSTGFQTASVTYPQISYKTSYLDSDKINRTYLGISERGYDSVGSKGKGLNGDLFKYVGDGVAVADNALKGFHMDANAATVLNGRGEVMFVAGPAPLAAAADIASGVFKDKTARKFTFVAAGGFDGWDMWRTSRTNTDDFVSGAAAFPESDYNAWGAALASFDNKEETPINLLATPGLNWFDHLSLVNATLELVERVRKDCLYIIDAPTASDLGPVEVTQMFNDASIDSSYAATYFPAIQVQDTTNNALVFLAPTGEVCRAMAVTDKLNFPWFASAGTTRGLIPAAKRTRVKLRESDRDILYAGRINPIANFHDVGVDIFGQKTTQKRDSALDRINVRRLMLYSKAIVSQISRALLFDQNDEKVASEFMKKVNPIFANIQRERGVNTFKVEQVAVPEGQSRNELLFRIKIIPVSSVEFIGIEFQITPQGAVFND